MSTLTEQEGPTPIAGEPAQREPGKPVPQLPSEQPCAAIGDMANLAVVINANGCSMGKKLQSHTLVIVVLPRSTADGMQSIERRLTL